MIFVSGCKHGVPWYDARSCVIAFVPLIYGCWLSTTKDCHTRCFGLSWAFLRLLWTHLPTGLVSLCSFYILWKIYAVYWPLKHRTLSTRAYAIVITIIWTLTALTTAIYVLSSNLISSRQASSYFSVILFLMFIFILCGCSICIWRKYQMRNISFEQIRGTK